MIPLWKPEGLTPRQALDRLKALRPDLADLSLTYAGRLDPMASGLLLALAGPETIAEKERYLALPKKYSAYIVFGFGTDSHDALGLAEPSPAVPLLEHAMLKNAIAALRGEYTFTLPMYSSQPVGDFTPPSTGPEGPLRPSNGSGVERKPLYQWAREGRTDIAPPTRTVEITKANLIEVREIGSLELWDNIRPRIERVGGDFRQAEILARWEALLAERPPQSFTTATIDIEAGSGIYIRALARDLGARLGTSAFLLHLIRTGIGDYTEDDALRLDEA